jgi:hypothetical protein
MLKRIAKAVRKRRQRRLNKWTKKYLENVTPLIVDGVTGHATKRRIMTVKFYLGYGKKRNAKFTSLLVRRMNNPHSRRYSTRQMLRTAASRRKTQRELERKPIYGKGYATYDDKTVPVWMVPWLNRARARGWIGRVVSGVRSEAYSIHLCYNMCGRSSCPGRCGGASSNHNMEANEGYPNGALDVSDYARFGRIMREIGAPLHNLLGAQDPVHFSVSGR